ncbi:MAG: acyltransferase [Bdellovibrionota bacterium]
MSLKVDTQNQSSITLGKGVRVGFFGRLYVNEPESGSQIILGDGSWMGRNVELQVYGGQTLTVGRRATVQDQTKLIGDVFLGAYSTLASNVFISSGTHQFAAEPTLLVKLQDERYPVKSSPVYIGEDTWIGNNVFVKSGVTIGRGCVIGANSVVLSDLEPYGVYAGTPAKKIKTRCGFEPGANLDAANLAHRIYFYEGFDHENVQGQGMEIVAPRARLAIPNSASSKNLKVDLIFEGAKSCEIEVGSQRLKIACKPGPSSINIPLASDHGGQFNLVPIYMSSRAGGRLYVSAATIQ